MRTSWWGTAAIVVFCALLVTVVVLWRVDDDAERQVPVANPVEENEPGFVAEFLTAWKRFRLGSFVVTSEFIRTLDDGSILRTPRVLAQDPPLRRTSEFSDASASFENAEVDCASDDLGFFSCLERGTGMESYLEVVQSEQILLASYLTGEPPLYVLQRSADGCFEFLIAQAVQLPPYGSRALFCFDEASGALARQLIVKEGAEDEIVATEIRTEVSAEDFALDQ